MKNLLILIVAAAVFLHFYPQPELQKWLNTQKEYVLGQFSEATDTKVHLKSSKIYDDLKPEFEHFNSEEIDFIKEMTSSRKSVAAFYVEYCQDKRSSTKLHGENQKKVCATIGRYSSLL